MITKHSTCSLNLINVNSRFHSSHGSLRIKIHNWRGHEKKTFMLQKIEIQRQRVARGTPEENITWEKPFFTAYWPSAATQKQASTVSLVHTDDSPVTSALHFGGSGSQRWGCELDSCPLEDWSSPNAAQLRAGEAKLHSSAAGKERKGAIRISCIHSAQSKYTLYIYISRSTIYKWSINVYLKTGFISSNDSYSNGVKLDNNYCGTLIMQLLISHLDLCHRVLSSFQTRWVQHDAASGGKWLSVA